MDESERREIKFILSSTKNWNGGRGLIVPPSFAQTLKKLGFEDGYSENCLINNGADYEDND